MRSWTLAFLCGVLLLQQLSFLPAKYGLLIALFSLFVLEIFLVKKHRIFYYLSAFLIGFTWTLWYEHSILSWNVPSELEGKPVLVSGYITSVPNVSENGTRFLFTLEKFHGQRTHALIKLSAREHAENLQVGDHWQWLVKLKRVHGLMNPGGFDYEAWALQAGIRANGYVVSSNENKLLDSHWYRKPCDRLRQKLKEKIEINLTHTNTSPWIVALAVGERQNIAAENWEVLRNTGTNHLMAIAGLHIGFMASFAFFLVNWAWRRSRRLMLMMPAQLAGGVAALSMALWYSLLAGFSIPTERACIMLSVTLVTLLLRKITLAWQAWHIALLMVLVFNPLSVLTESFWLSFGSVAFIIYGVSGRLNPTNLWWKLGRIQWVIAVGLIPLGIWLFQQFSLISFVANSIAIPLVGFLIVPLTLLGCLVLCFSGTGGGYILGLADKLLALLWKILAYFAHLSWANTYLMIPNHLVLVMACLGIVMLLAPAGFRGKWLGVFWFLPLFFYRYPTPALGEVWFTLLDVGQGLSAVVQTKHHLLVFDVGAKLDNYDMGESVVAPFLRSNGIKKIDKLVVSHPDNDHIGGAKTLFHYFQVKETKSSALDELRPFAATYCLRGGTWQWDQVNFKFLYPTPETLHLDNDSSCVLQVTNAAHKRVLLTGDIEKFAEEYLVKNEGENLAADILVAPHHGSKTSALTGFVQDVKPSYVLFPVGYRNRYHFPHASVVEKYEKLSANLLETDSSGAIEFKVGKKVVFPEEYRLRAGRYWNNVVYFKRGAATNNN